MMDLGFWAAGIGHTTHRYKNSVSFGTVCSSAIYPVEAYSKVERAILALLRAGAVHNPIIASVMDKVELSTYPS